jgi:hypothetical protein
VIPTTLITVQHHNNACGGFIIQLFSKYTIKLKILRHEGRVPSFYTSALIEVSCLLQVQTAIPQRKKFVVPFG